MQVRPRGIAIVARSTRCWNGVSGFDYRGGGAPLRIACRRPGDLVFRLGGEELGILSTHQPDSDPALFGEIIRSGVEALQIPHSHSDAGRFMTVSAGLVNRVPGPEDTVEKLAGLADKRLYRAKAQGRNRVVTSGS